MAEYIVKQLNTTTWADFSRLVEKHNGVWGGCWCMSFHEEGIGRQKTIEQNRTEKACRVREGRAHAALVYDGDTAIGWCQFGSPAELPRIKHKKAYQEAFDNLPDWRITCFFVDRHYRQKGVASAALDGALKEIARLGGGVVESYPEDTDGRSLSGSFLWNATLSLFERHGFQKTRKIGKHCWVVRRTVESDTA